MAFWIYDVGFLILFSIFIAVFLYLNRHKIKREGILFLYRTRWGINSIKKFSDKYSRILKALKYVVILIGFILTAGILYILGQAAYIYIAYPQITKIISAPPIAPLIPYFPKLFGLESFFPDFYFTYFLIALAIVAIVHEFSHGIFMKLFKIRIKSTGLVFLGPILGAFVEQDDKQMKKKKKSEQMAVLGAGTFANLIFAGVFFLLLLAFFYISFSPSGFIFNTYAYSILPASLISDRQEVGNLTEIYADGQIFYLDAKLKEQLNKNLTNIIAYDDTPAFHAGLAGIILEIDGEKIRNRNDLIIFLEKKSPGDIVQIKTLYNEKERFFTIKLSEHPVSQKAYIGIVSIPRQTRGIAGKFLAFFSFKDESIYYETKGDGNLIYFIYNLLWWIMVINFLVALFNMLPLGILDGGRFFYLGILSLTKSEKFAKKSFKFISFLIIFLFLTIIFLWLFNII